MVTFTGRELGQLGAEKRKHSRDMIADFEKLKTVFISREVLLYAALVRERRTCSWGLRKDFLLMTAICKRVGGLG